MFKTTFKIENFKMLLILNGNETCKLYVRLNKARTFSSFGPDSWEHMFAHTCACERESCAHLSGQEVAVITNTEACILLL